MTHFILRDPKGRTQTTLAKLFGVDQSFLSRILRGERRPSIELAEKIADEFRLHVLHVMAPERYDKEGNRLKVSDDSEVLEGFAGWRGL